MRFFSSGKNHRRGMEQGLSMAGTLVAIGLAMVVAAATVSLLRTSMQASKHQTNTVDLNMAKQMIINSMNCAQTVPAGSGCNPADTFLLRDKNGDPLFNETVAGSGQMAFGPWVMTANCVDDGLVIQAVTANKELLTNRNRTIASIFRDSAVKLCGGRFTPPGGGGGGGAGSYTPSFCTDPTYTIQGGPSHCCRLVIDKKYAGDGKPNRWGTNTTIARADCDGATEYLQFGGGRCQVDAASDDVMTYPGVYLHTSEPYIDANNHPIGWWADCDIDYPATAFALCCPR